MRALWRLFEIAERAAQIRPVRQQNTTSQTNEVIRFEIRRVRFGTPDNYGKLPREFFFILMGLKQEKLCR